MVFGAEGKDRLIASPRFIRTEAGEGLFVAAGRLDNHTEIGTKLGWSGERVRRASALDIMAASFEAWGESCARQFEGDWSFAACVNRGRELTLARDACGNSSLFYSINNETPAFASTVATLRRLVSPGPLSDLGLARCLLAWPGDDPFLTVFEGVRSVPPGHTVTITPSGIRTSRYWILESVPELTLKSDGEYVEALGDALIASVKRRLTSSRVASTLSAGLDSSAVTATAARELARDGHSLLALTAVPLASFVRAHGRGAQGDEGPLAEATARYLGVEHIQTDSREVSPIAAIRSVIEHLGEPAWYPSNLHWILDLTAKARDDGRGVLLTGQYGNAVLSWPGAFPSVRQQIARGLTGGPSGLRRWLSSRMVSPARRRRRGLRRYWDAWQIDSAPWRQFSAVSLDFARQVRIREAMADAGYVPGLGKRRLPDVAGRRLALLRPTFTVGSVWSHIGRRYGVDVWDPTQDRALVALSYSIPDRVWCQGFRSRGMVRRLMNGRLPERVRLNTGHHFQARDVQQRLQLYRRDVTAALEQVAGSDAARRCIDINYCRALLAALDDPPSPALRNALNSALLRGLSVGLFLVGLENSR